MNRSLLHFITTSAVVLLFLVAYIPLLVLSSYNHPSAADDYCFADTTLKYGFWEAQKFYYDGWTGRYFSNFLVHGSPLVWHWYAGFRFIPALAVTGLILAIASLVEELTRTDGVQRSAQPTVWVVTGLVFFTIITALTSISEAFFWMATIPCYTMPTSLTIYLLAVIIRWYRLKRTALKSLTVVWAVFLVFAIVGCSETNLILIVLLLLALAGYRLVFQQTADWFLIGLVLVSFVSSWLLFRAPGNAIRMGGNPHSGEFVQSAIGSFGWLAQSAGQWLLRSPVLPLSILFLPLSVKITRPGATTRFLFMGPAWLVVVAYCGLLAAMVFPSYYGIGLPPANRTANTIFIVFVVGWFYTLATLVRATRLGISSEKNNRLFLYRLTTATPLVILVGVGIWIGAGLWFSVPIRQMYNDLRLGYAARYDREMTTRREQLLKPGKTVFVQPISVYPPSLFVEDVHNDPKFLWNRCQAGYYGHEAIILK
jgi:hypothetical protein